MNYENYPIKYSEFNLITSPASDAVLEEFNRQFIKATFCDLPEPELYETENRIIVDVIDAFFDDDENDALCQNDPLLFDKANELDKEEKISRERLNMLLLDKCDGLKIVIIDNDADSIARYLITKDRFVLTGLIGAHLASSIDPDVAETFANFIADEISFDPDKIKALVLPADDEDIEVINESSFSFEDDYDDDETFASVDELIDHMDRKSKEHENNNTRKFCAEQFRKLVDGFLSPQEQESFLKIANEFLKNKNYDHPDQ